MPRDLITLEPNIPLQVTFEYVQGKEYSGKNGSRFFHGTTDGRGIYLAPEAEAQFLKLGIRKGDPVVICKRELNGSNGHKETRWEIEKVPAPENTTSPHKKPQAAAQLLDASADVHGAYQDDPALQTQLEHALKTALLAAAKAEKYLRGNRPSDSLR